MYERIFEMGKRWDENIFSGLLKRLSSYAALRLTASFDPTRRKKATLKQSGFSHLFSAKKYLETR